MLSVNTLHNAYDLDLSKIFILVFFFFVCVRVKSDMEVYI